MSAHRCVEEPGGLTGRLRAAGCVFAEQEADALCRAARASEELERLVRRREAGQPLEHVVGSVEFAGLALSVGPGVFVPRQRSLLLARLAAARARAQPAPVLLEVCAGVAPIASAVTRQVRGVETHASDIAELALGHARRNLPPTAAVHPGHLLEALPASLRQRVTLLVAVPPYVPTHAAELLPREAREYEPARALFGGPDGLDLVRELLDTAHPWLAPQARVLLEVHREQHAAATAHAQRAGLSSRPHLAADGQTAVIELAVT
jgi:release factor glutamine methyltransferase